MSFLSYLALALAVTSILATPGAIVVFVGIWFATTFEWIKDARLLAAGVILAILLFLYSMIGIPLAITLGAFEIIRLLSAP